MLSRYLLALSLVFGVTQMPTDQELADTLRSMTPDPRQQRIDSAMTPKGLSLDQVAQRDETEASDNVLKDLLVSMAGGRSNSSAPRSESLGLRSSTPAATVPALSSVAVKPNRPKPSETVSVFQNEADFGRVTHEASKGSGDFQNVHHWTPPRRAKPYLSTLTAADEDNALPDNLMASLVQQESAFRTGLVSKKGARGIAQIVPKWHPEADTDDPHASIEYGAKYLSDLRKQFDGDLELALTAYNWGPTNLRKHLNEHGELNRTKAPKGYAWPKGQTTYLPKEASEYAPSVMSRIHADGS